MIRVLLYFIGLAVLAYAGMLLVQNPGHVTLTWFGEVVEAPAALIIGAIALAAVVAWSILRFVFGLPSFVRFASRQRRREKGYEALSRGLIAVGSGDGRTAGRAASQANRHLKNDPLAIMLRAQAAHMNGEGYVASAAFEELAQRDDTRVLGLRGLHAEAARRGDEEAARHFAAAAHDASPLPWSAQAVLEHRASSGDWEQALATVETSLAARLIEKDVGERQRAVLETAIAYDKEMVAPEAALVLARSAIKRAPDLAPPVVLAARLLSRRGDIRKASKLIERAWPRCQHPDIAEAYLDVRPGDSTQDRLTRAKTLMGIATFDSVSRTTVARAALGNKDFDAAREAMAPLVAEGKRPTVRQCLLMAELEEAEHGDDGLWREWVARASRAPLDPAWVCDGIVYDHWAPASPKTGQLDAFHWQVPAERLGPAIDALPIPRRRPEPSLPAAPAAALIHHDAVETPAAAPSLPDAEPPSAASPPSPPAAVPAPATSPSARMTPPTASDADPVAAREIAPTRSTTTGPIAAPPAPSEVAEPVETAEPPETGTSNAVVAGTPAAIAQRAEERPDATSVSAETPHAGEETAPTTSASYASPPAVARSVTVDPPRTSEPRDPVAASHESERPSVNPRIHLPPDIEAEGRHPGSSHALFHRRVTPESEPIEPRNDEGQGRAEGSAGTVSTSPWRADRVSSDEADAHAAESPSPNPRISVPLETVPEDRNPGEPRALFHRRLTPEAEVIAARTVTNGTSGGTAPQPAKSAATQANGGSRPYGRPGHATGGPS